MGEAPKAVGMLGVGVVLWTQCCYYITNVAVNGGGQRSRTATKEMCTPGSEFLKPGPVPTGNTRQFRVTDDGHRLSSVLL